MLRFLAGEELRHYPRLRDTMFTDRARQFRERLGWAVNVDHNGWERDDYDTLNPTYVIWQLPDGSHGGSMRFLPTTGRTMVNEHFSNLSAGRRFSHPRVWECTRFCLADHAAPNVSALLMLGGAQLGVGLGLARAVGVFDARMVRIYRLLGWEPAVLGTEGKGAEAISLGLWEFSEEVRRRLARKSGISPEVAQLWFDRAFGHRKDLPAAG
ncbi:Acyl-homoserine-lactone synthase [Defluviimonas aquaemixtae]|uniref:Acyl-homoserine-lactone synthase n=1 Tax=Albidovulum aquaemixtae TaxID=1542388 RepID=A0A2R8BMF1_9RHOB|nr:acyl-homoserine-lactone synthase [Defluviimonas aquaemixtae]SPH24586.1 Acyl-homoserine-lactone synthase [Defluviimonas aquaemixtae]